MWSKSQFTYTIFLQLFNIWVLFATLNSTRIASLLHEDNYEIINLKFYQMMTLCLRILCTHEAKVKGLLDTYNSINCTDENP